MRVRLTLFVLWCGLIAGAENGIDVGKPKVYDNRSLLIMLDELNNRFRSVQFIDQKALADAFGMQQGYESQDVATGFNASVSASPAGGSGSNSSSAPSLPDLPTAPAFTPKFGENPADLLADQVNLTYQVFNIRMLLERSLSDRLIGDDTRLQAVVGFNISLAPPFYAKDCAAFVEVTLSSAEVGKPAPSLVAVMPQEKTYNSSALSQHATAFAGSAVARMFTVGFTQRRRGQMFYLFRDADTVSFESMGDADAMAAHFGWQFRPVLGRRSVSPGMRQLFAVISFPARDEVNGKDPFNVNVTVKTYWHRYDHHTLTTYENPWFFSRTFWATLFGPPIPGSEEVHTAKNLPVYTTFASQDDLTPRITNVTWTPVGNGKAVVVVKGKNFFPGTTAVLGGKTLTGPSSGLILKSDQAMHINTDVAALATGDAIVNGRYGPSVRLETGSKDRAGFKIVSVSVDPMGEQFYKLVANLSGISMSDIRPELPPIVALNGTPVPTVPTFQQDGRIVRMEMAVPAAMLKSLDAVLLIKFPFSGAGGSATFPIYDPCHPKIDRVGGGDTTTLVISRFLDCAGDNPNPNWSVQLDKTYRPQVVGDLLVLPIASSVLKNFKNLLLSFDVPQPNDKSAAVTKLLPIPPSTAPAAQPKLDPAQADPKPGSTAMRRINRGDSYGVVFNGTDLGGIKYAEFDGDRLRVEPGADGKKLTVYITPAVTEEPGRKDILLYGASGHVIAAPVLVIPKDKIKSVKKGKVNP